MNRLTNLAQDLRFASRTLRKSPVFLLVAVLSLALGIGANTAIFTLTDQLLLRLLPVHDAQQLVLFSAEGQHYGSNMGWNRISYPMYQDFRDHNSVFTGMFCFREVDFSLSFGDRTERVSGELVSGNYFPVLGVQPALGRLFTADDDLHQGGHPVAVISYGYWRSRFHGDPTAVGRKIIINGYPFTIIGVSQAGFTGTDPAHAPDVRVPVMMAKQVQDYLDLNDRRTRWVTAFGRLRPGVDITKAQASIQPYFHNILRMEVKQPAFAKASGYMRDQFLKMSMTLQPASRGRSGTRREFQKPLLVLMFTVALVLLIACANVANLLIARATSRQKEIAVRLALGSTRMRIISQLLMESALLALAGGVAGLALAVWMDRTLIGFLPPSNAPMTISALPDWRILTFNFGLCILTSLIFGLVPALQSTRPDLAPTLKDQAGAVVGGGSTNLRKALVAAQVALSLLLLIGAGLFIRSLGNLKDLYPGFRTTNLLAFKIDPTLNGYKPDRSRDIYRRLSDRLSALPGVESASLAIMPVLEGDEWDQWVTIDTYKPKSGELPDPHMNFVSPGYFKTLQTPLLLGRDFRPGDDQAAPKVAIVNETFAKKYFAGGTAIGHQIGMGIDPGTKTDITIIGVAQDIKYESMRDEVPPEVFRPYQQMEFVSGMAAYLRTPRNSNQVFTTIRSVVREIDPNLPLYDMITLEKQMDDSLVTERLVASLSSAFGFIATLLAAIGLYGVVAYTVARRTREIGIRMAVGAATRDVVWLVMREVLVLLAIGVGVALPSAFLLTRFVRNELYGIQPSDPLSIALATGSIAAVVILAGLIPARRATRVDPMKALRYE
jgi:predicted permease